jgi:DNA mismatch endonuclease, patch repair protein
MVRQLPPPPKAASLNVSKVMKANKAKGTKPELYLRRFLWESGFRGYRLNPRRVVGRPDICFIGKKLAIFVNGCFWHRCPICLPSLPKTNTEFWKRKFELNVARDITKTKMLEALGWRVLVIWECELKKKDYTNLIEFLV